MQNAGAEQLLCVPFALIDVVIVKATKALNKKEEDFKLSNLPNKIYLSVRVRA